MPVPGVGIYISFDDGGNWQSLQKNLPVTSVRDITIHDTDVVIATHGRGFWILDDVSALRQLDAKVETAAAWLFAPATAYRVRHPAFTGTPLPKDEPMAPNPPDGAYIDYALKSAASTPVTLEITDAGGAIVRRYSSADKPEVHDPKKSEVAPEWIKEQSVLSAAPGMHRFVWPLHYAAVDTGGKHDPFADGVWAPPGKYGLVLSAGGERLTRTLDVAADPRVKLPEQAYVEQFALARQIAISRARVADTAAEAAKLIEQLAARRKGAAATLAQDIDALTQRTHELAGTRAAANPHNAWSFPPRSVQSLRFVDEALDKLGQAVDGADAAPSPDAREGVRKLAPLMAACLGRWESLKTTDIPALNEKLRAAGQPLIDLHATGA